MCRRDGCHCQVDGEYVITQCVVSIPNLQSTAWLLVLSIAVPYIFSAEGAYKNLWDIVKRLTDQVELHILHNSSGAGSCSHVSDSSWNESEKLGQPV